MNESAARSIALSLPEAVEQDHHGIPSFRVRGKIFATLPDEHHLNVMLDAEQIRVTAAENPSVCEEQWWGRRLAAVRLELGRSDEALVTELLTDAWRRKAPRSMHGPLDR